MKDGFGINIVELRHRDPREPNRSDLPGGITLLPFQFTVTHAEANVSEDGVELKVYAMVRDRDTGAPREIIFRHSERDGWFHQHPRETVRRILIEMLTHEVDEVLLSNGVRQDPHAPRQR